MPSFMRSPSPCRLSSHQEAAMTREEGKCQRPCAPPASPLPLPLPCRPPLVVVEGLRPLPSAFYHVLPPPSTEKIETARPWVVSLSWRIFPVLSVVPVQLGRVDEFEIFPTKSVSYRKTDFSLNASKINGLLLIRQHALVTLWLR